MDRNAVGFGSLSYIFSEIQVTIACFMDLNCLKQCLNLKTLNCWAARAGDDATWGGVQDTEREHS